MAASALTAETDRDVLPWLQLAEDLRMLNLDCEVRKLAKNASDNIPLIFTFPQ